MVGFFAVLEPRNQDVMLWGSSPTPVHKLCALAQQTSQSADLASSLSCTLLAVCVYNHRTCEVSCGQPDPDCLSDKVTCHAAWSSRGL